MTTIEWTHREGFKGETWNPVRGCRRVSPGCQNCYAERVAGRFSGPGQPYEGLVTVSSRHSGNGRATLGSRARWNGEARFVPEQLSAPLHWRAPRMVFVNSMSDLFYEGFTNEQIAAVFGVMAACEQHVFQVLTKRPGRMRSWFEWVEHECSHGNGRGNTQAELCRTAAARHGLDVDACYDDRWPLPNVWLGFSAENQQTLDERAPDALACPAAVHFLSYEPALGPIDIRATTMAHQPALGWVIAGSESGPGKRPSDLGWFRAVRDRCARTGVPFFMKQLVRDGKLTKDMAEFPEDLRIREFPR